MKQGYKVQGISYIINISINTMLTKEQENRKLKMIRKSLENRSDS